MKDVFKISGEKRLEKLLHKLAPSVQRKLERQGISKALTPFVREAKKRAPKESGLLKKSIAKKIKRYGDRIVGIAGPKRQTTGTYKGKFRRPANYAHLSEFGHRVAKGGKLARAGKRPTKKTTGEVAAVVPAKPWMRPAFAATRGEMLTTIKNTVTVGIVAELKKQ